MDTMDLEPEEPKLEDSLMSNWNDINEGARYGCWQSKALKTLANGMLEHYESCLEREDASMIEGYELGLMRNITDNGDLALSDPHHHNSCSKIGEYPDEKKGYQTGDFVPNPEQEPD